MRIRRLIAPLRAAYRKLSLRGRFVAMYCLAGILPLLITNIYASSILNSNERDNQMLAAETGYEQTISFISDKLYRIIRMCDVIALDASLQQCLYGHDPENYSVYQQFADRSTLLTFLAQKKDDLDIHNIRLYVRDELIYSQSGSVIYGLRTAQDQLWYQELQNIQYQVLFCPPAYLPESDMLAVARRVRNLDNLNHVEAVLRIDFPLEEIAHILKNGCTVQGSTSMILTNHGSLVVASHETVPEIDSLDSIIREAGLNEGFISAAPGSDQLIQCLPIPHTDWLLLTVLSKTAMYDVSRQAWAGVVLLLFGTGTVTMLAARRMLANMTSRLTSLDLHMRNVRAGMLVPTDPDPNQDEIGRMTVSYNYMIDRIGTLVEEQFEMGRAMQSTELLALQSQINPHFLYNTLDMLQWMSRLEHNEAVQDVLQALADFYRNSLSGGEDIVPLETELRIVESYMKIQRYRFGEGICLVIDIAPEAMDCKLPKITLQPLVENALIHGISPKLTDKGTIRITGGVEEDILWLETADDGVGAPQEHLESLLHRKKQSEDKSGYGLYNINQRLELFFQTPNCMSFRSMPGEGTAARIEIPLRR